MADEADSPLGGPLELPEDSTSHRYMAPQKPPKKTGRYVIIIVIVALVLAILGFVGWKLTKSKSSNDAQANTIPGSGEAKTTKPTYTAAPGTKTYTNDRMRLTLSHPDNWTVEEISDAFLVESPDFSYETVDKGEVDGNFRVYVRLGAKESDSKIIGRGYAIEPSEKLVYAQPTSTQRKETLLTPFGLDEPNNFAYFLIAGNFDLKKGDTLGPNFGKEADTLIIAGGYSSKDMNDGLETNKVPVEGFNESTAYKQAVDILKSIQVQ